MKRQKRKTFRQSVNITPDQVFDTWDESLVDYSCSFKVNVSRQILSYLKKSKSLKELIDSVDNQTDLDYVRLNSVDVSRAILIYLDVARITNFEDSSKSQVYITSLSDPELMTDSYSNLNELLSQLKFENGRTPKNVKDDLIEFLTQRVLEVLQSIDELDELRPLPDHYLSTSRGVYDINEKRYLKLDEVKDYDVTSKFDWFIMSDEIQDSLSQHDKSMYTLLHHQFSKAFDNWTAIDDTLEAIDEQKRYLLKQVMISGIINDGQGKLIELVGSGGNGKSSFSKCIRSLIGSNYTAILNINDLDNDNKLASIKSDTKAIIGFDAATNTHLKGRSLSIFKSLIQNEELSIDEKYKPVRYLKFKGLYLQSTNTEIQFHENTAAIRDRLILLELSPVNFRYHDSKLNLDEMISSEIGRSALASMLFETVKSEDYRKYKLTDEMRTAIDKTINGADTLNYFLDDCQELFNGVKYVSTNFLYKLYSQWFLDKRSGTKMSEQNFITSIVPKMKDLDYKLAISTNKSDQRMRFSEKSRDVSNMYMMFSCEYNLSTTKSRYFEKIANPITNKEVEETVNQFLSHSDDDLSDREVLCLTWAKYVKHSTHLIDELQNRGLI